MLKTRIQLVRIALALSAFSSLFSGSSLRAADCGSVFSSTPFDIAVPAEKGSIEDSLPQSEKIYARLTALERKYLDDAMLDDPDHIASKIKKSDPSPVTSEDVANYILEQRKEMAKELSQLASHYSKLSPPAVELLKATIELIEPSDKSLQRFNANRYEYASAYSPASWETILGYASVVKGAMGEIKAIVRVANISQASIKVFEIPNHFKGPKAQQARAELDALLGADKGMYEKELDFVANGGRIWGEIKNYRDPVNGSGEFSHIKEQAERTVAIRNRILSNPTLREIFDGKIELRIYVINGISKQNAETLEKLGYKVFGPRV